MNQLQPGEDLSIQFQKIGRDYLFTICGGDHHIGAVSTAYKGQGKDQQEWVVQTNKVPGHKEYVLTEPMAQQAAQELQATVTVCAGIHYDHLTTSEIEAVVDRAWKQFLLTLSAMK
ncbi:hypothetical protein [Paenibacillus alvei]|uniref:Prenylated flavin chaperone LpdD-like domain-containing protein n=1 Tax=Paenibacillus alvei TaxID=44250 RepID=A0AAP7DKT8_PAEAL|nr:hypothetical protein [Paenibacillus alvei]MBG9733898.1 hypothetical protein [Paenibacillus alvei]MBG9746498.1 hypothetical protein [Paenibacillus alvei]MCY9582578.1 hypothetical protein [Paenibacillus alvei]MCY9587851.1 hypothetical protein [Paenibacillus alvei]NEZ42329.1 hypothetical protein [Paenibacillus alvei]